MGFCSFARWICTLNLPKLRFWMTNIDLQTSEYHSRFAERFLIVCRRPGVCWSARTLSLLKIYFWIRTMKINVQTSEYHSLFAEGFFCVLKPGVCSFV